MNLVKLLSTNLRLCPSKHVRTAILFSNKNNDYNNVQYKTPGYNIQKRDYSLQATFDSIARTQSGIFQSLSESTCVEYIQALLLNIHDTTGLPWWATIMCTTILLRSSVTVPLAIYQQYILAKVENLNMEMPDIVKELKRETAIAIKLYNWDEKTAKIQFKKSCKKQWNDLIVRDNCHPIKASLLLWFQIPMWICLSVSLRNLVYELPKLDIDAKLTLAELTVGGFGWIPNLTEVDASFILPISLGLINLGIIEVQNLSKLTVPSKFQRYATNFFRGLTILLVPIAASVPSCLVLYWTTSSAYGLAQNLILMSPKVKKRVGVPLTPSQLEYPYTHLIEGFKHKLSFNKLK